MEQEMRVSIICNVFNHAQYLRDALDGFVMQKTDFPFEVLIHDDASTDGSQDIIREYEEKYPDIIKPIYQTENQYSKKVKISRTFQAPRAKGKYIAICEGDDYWTDPLKLQKQSDFLEAHPDYAMCTCSTDWLNLKSGRHEAQGRIEQDMDIPLEEIILEEHGRIFQLASVMVKRDIWDTWPEWRTKFPIGDLPLAILAGLNGKVHMLADMMTVYRYFSANSWSVRVDNDEARAKISLQMIAGLEALNEATNGAHDAVIQKRIKKHKYVYAVMTHDLKMVRSPELREHYETRKWYYHICVFIHCKFPRLYNLVLRPLIRAVQ